MIEHSTIVMRIDVLLYYQLFKQEQMFAMLRTPAGANKMHLERSDKRSPHGLPFD